MTLIFSFCLFRKQQRRYNGRSTTHLTELILYYSEFYGDSTSQSRLNVYTLDEKLEANYYADINPDDYYDETKPPLVSKTFTPLITHIVTQLLD